MSLPDTPPSSRGASARGHEHTQEHAYEIEEPNRLGAVLRFVWILVCVAMVATFALQLVEESAMAGLALGWALATVGLLFTARRLGVEPSRRRIDVRAASGRLEVDGASVVRREDVDASTMVSEGESRLILRRRWSPRLLLGTSPWVVLVAPARSALEPLAAAVGHEDEVFEASSLRARAAWQIAVGLLAYVGLSGTFLRLLSLLHVRSSGTLASVGAFALVAAYGATTSTSVRVGTDGIAIRRGLRRRFVPVGAIRSVSEDPDDLFVTLDDGEEVALARTAATDAVGGFGDAEGALERLLLHERVVRTVERKRQLAASDAATHALGRRDRSTDAWVEAVRAIGLGAGEYRSHAFRQEDLPRIAADVSVAADARIGAAVAWRIAEGVGAAERLRVLAETTASPELRDALREIAEAPGDEATATLRRRAKHLP